MGKKTRTTHTTTSSRAASEAPKRSEAATKPKRKPYDKSKPREFKPRDPAKRIKDPAVVQKIFKDFVGAASTARIDYARLGADESAVAGLLAQLAILAFGQDGQGGFRKVGSSKLKRSKAAEALRPGMVVRYKKAGEQAEVEEEAGKEPIVVLKVGAKTVRVVCNGFEYTPLASQIELDPNAQQPTEDDEVNEVLPGDAGFVKSADALRALGADEDEIPFGSDEDEED